MTLAKVSNSGNASCHKKDPPRLLVNRMNIQIKTEKLSLNIMRLPCLLLAAGAIVPDIKPAGVSLLSP